MSELDSFAERFWARVEKSDCWTWAGAKNEKGYGVVGRDSRTPKAHRVAWELANGPIPEGACVLHKCDNPPCCNPAHLFLGSRADNNRDMNEKGRHRIGTSKTPIERCAYSRGVQHPQSKMTEELVRMLRADRAAGMSFSKLGAKYGVNMSAAWKIANRVLWAHVA